MKHKKYLAMLVCLLFGLARAFACAGCIEPIPVPASVTGDNPRHYRDWHADASFWFSDPNRVSVYNHVFSGNSDLRKSGTYRIVYEYGVPFIHFDWAAHTSPRTIGERFLILRNEYFMLLYNGNTEPAFHASYGDAFIHANQLHCASASSTLTHGGLYFAASPDRLGTHINRVWAVEGGVGERLYIAGAWHGAIFLSIGYVHYSRPYLFQANSRPKRLRISNALDEERFIEVELEDTPHYQTIWLEELGRTHGSAIIEILEIRPGFRYNHLCINSIMTREDGSP